MADDPKTLIPGARERSTLTPRRPGSGGFASRSTEIPAGDSSMDAATIAGHQREGGGAPNQRSPVSPKKA